MLPRELGSGWTWETNVTEVNCTNPSRNRSERRDKVVLPPRVASALRRAMVQTPPTSMGLTLLVLYKLQGIAPTLPREAASAPASTRLELPIPTFPFEC